MSSLVGILLLLLGAAMVWGAISTRRSNRSFRGWPTTPARFVRKEVRDYDGPGADPGDVTAFVEYEYTVGGRTFRSSRISVAGSTPWGGLRAHSRVERVLGRFHDGMEVRYDPEHPETAALLPFPAWAIWVLAVGGPLTILCGLATFLGS